MTKADYAEQRLNPQWQKKRLEILSRDNFKCLICESPERTLHVHHSYYIPGRNPWDYPNWSLMTLCKDCHPIGQLHARTEFCDFEFLLEYIAGGSAEVVRELSQEIDAMRCDMRAEPGPAIQAALRELVVIARQTALGIYQ
jgi:hypothetical protein